MDEQLTPEAARERLRQVRILSDVTDATLDALAAKLSWRSVHTGDEVV